MRTSALPGVDPGELRKRDHRQCAVGGSTNAVIHLLAIAGRAGIELTLEDFDAIGGQVPCLVNCMPSGQYLMEDFAYAGGMPALMKSVADLMRGAAPTVMGRPISTYWDEAENFNEDVIPSARQSAARSRRHPRPQGQHLAQWRGDQTVGSERTSSGTRRSGTCV
jgi:dihydroxyacid dehydratase/phosphogluconate dehydratase